ncbi:hypothetical protein G6M89_04035 [Natronolimnobius sp. AArcel1]|uniref:hypothetical protein n=1 Tax=Natronolimnobius sp. AArcel1 TaxID=1679093 RepID=UPI0013ED93D6|nr:hypothetical protein [Natronolimnobius sp. AArcel1]NGM68187.1 hypothetical protein [Natronolimnobius sp. AArcel1]
MPSPISLRPRVKSALLWGAVGFMAFLVLVQGYALARGPLVSITQGAGVALLVAAGSAAGAYVLEHRVAAWSAQRVVGETDSHNDAD